MEKPTAEIWCATHRGVSDETKASFEASGYPVRLTMGVSDTALARNLTLTRAALALKADVLLMADDDMVIPAEAAHKLVELAHRLQKAVSALYLTGNQKAAAFELERGDSWETSRWVTGLGALAIPRALLLKLDHAAEALRGDGETIKAFCWSGPGSFPIDSTDDERRWVSEDYSLCLRLGGVVLAPIGVGHLKPVAIWPSLESLQEVKAGQLGASFEEEEARMGRDEEGDAVQMSPEFLASFTGVPIAE